MNLIRREPRVAALNPAFEPFALMRSLARWDPFREMEFGGDAASFMPSFDIKETADGYVFLADLPGVRREDLDIQLTGNRLSISGKREAEPRGEGEHFFVTERSFGSFCRTFNLPEGVDGEAVSADLQSGVLLVKIPKVPEVKPRKIAIGKG